MDVISNRILISITKLLLLIILVSVFNALGYFCSLLKPFLLLFKPLWCNILKFSNSLIPNKLLLILLFLYNWPLVRIPIV